MTSETPKEAAFGHGRGPLHTTVYQNWRLAPSLPQNTGEWGVNQPVLALILILMSTL